MKEEGTSRKTQVLEWGVITGSYLNLSLHYSVSLHPHSHIELLITVASTHSLHYSSVCVFICLQAAKVCVFMSGSWDNGTLGTDIPKAQTLSHRSKIHRQFSYQPFVGSCVSLCSLFMSLCYRCGLLPSFFFFVVLSNSFSFSMCVSLK